MDEANKNILYVDDEEINQSLFKLSFRSKFNVFTAGSAKEGMEMLKENNIPIVLTDYKMPVMNGLKFIEEIKKLHPEKICIIVTGYMDMVTRGMEDMVFSLIQKPWKKEEVINIIQSGFDSYNKKQ